MILKADAFHGQVWAAESGTKGLIARHALGHFGAPRRTRHELRRPLRNRQGLLHDARVVLRQVNGRARQVATDGSRCATGLSPKASCVCICQPRVKPVGVRWLQGVERPLLKETAQ